MQPYQTLEEQLYWFLLVVAYFNAGGFYNSLSGVSPPFTPTKLFMRTRCVYLFSRNLSILLLNTVTS